MSEDTRLRLLAAAEEILIKHGISALTVRRVGQVSGLNPTLITYHFKTMANLLSELLQANLAPMQVEWERLPNLDEYRPVDDILEIWLKPLMRPAAYNPDGRALCVLDEIAAHGDNEMSQSILQEMRALSLRMEEILRPHIEGLPGRELRARLRFISGAVLGPPPRTPIRREAEMEPPLDSWDYLLAFARASLGL